MSFVTTNTKFKPATILKAVRKRESREMFKKLAVKVADTSFFCLAQVFGEMGVAGMDESIKQALVKGTSYQGVDNTVSRSSLRSRTRAGSAASSVSSFRRPSVLLEVPKTAGGPRSPSPV